LRERGLGGGGVVSELMKKLSELRNSVFVWDNIYLFDD
jgi:hypothetical protein